MLENLLGSRIKMSVLALLVAGSTLCLSSADARQRQMLVREGEKEIKVSTIATDPAMIIQEAGLVLNQGDTWKIVSMGPGKGTAIEIIRAKHITVSKDDKLAFYGSSQHSVGAVLKDLKISFKEDRVFPPADKEAYEGQVIHLLDRKEALSCVEEIAPFPVEYTDVPTMAQGIEIVDQEGKDGKVLIGYKEYVDKGGVSVKTELDRYYTVPPVPAKIRRGTAPSVLTEQGYKKIKKKFIAHTTAYVATGNLTAIGLVPYEGVIAVDPKFIPFYTKIYVPGYGIGMAGDTGGMIKENCLDLFMDDYDRAVRWGRRDIEAYILEDDE